MVLAFFNNLIAAAKFLKFLTQYIMSVSDVLPEFECAFKSYK